MVRKAGIPVYVPPMGKGVIDEDLPEFGGVYFGALSSPDVIEATKSSDLVITIGHMKSDLNTAGFTYHYSRLHAIDLHDDHVVIKHARIEKVYFKSLVTRLERKLNSSKLSSTAKQTLWTSDASQAPETGTENIISHAYLFPRLSRLLREGDVLVTETGTSYVGHWDTKLPRDVTVINQILWSSIGYGVGAAQGAALAARDVGRNQRVICFEGDGSSQLTAQELSTII